MISVDKSTSEPLYLQIYESARQTIASGGFQPGDRLPSIRALMDDLGVSRNTVMNAYNTRYGEWYSTVPWLEQEVLRRFMEEGLWDRHVRRVVSDVRDRHARLMECIDREFGDAVQVVGDAAGLHVLLKVGNGMRQEELVRTASEHGIRVGSTRRYWMNPTDAPDDTVLLGYSGASIPEIEGGITGLARAWLR